MFCEKHFRIFLPFLFLCLLLGLKCFERNISESFFHLCSYVCFWTGTKMFREKHFRIFLPFLFFVFLLLALLTVSVYMRERNKLQLFHIHITVSNIFEIIDSCNCGDCSHIWWLICTLSLKSKLYFVGKRGSPKCLASAAAQKPSTPSLHSSIIYLRAQIPTCSANVDL